MYLKEKIFHFLQIDQSFDVQILLFSFTLELSLTLLTSTQRLV